MFPGHSLCGTRHLHSSYLLIVNRRTQDPLRLRRWSRPHRLLPGCVQYEWNGNGVRSRLELFGVDYNYRCAFNDECLNANPIHGICMIEAVYIAPPTALSRHPLCFASDYDLLPKMIQVSSLAEQVLRNSIKVANHQLDK
ncbi:hypothetical protein PFISCL1PPCAC_15415 [Pristionchus fissidentatus]|uniref:Uncharacterized protein n=1 Tax=Pristionchus fissidentatus TaxID=1538716 RepID=A0AAV5W0X1_9BILA|nr:hypothetical protein PFISCL1PPCAC_15415 [Pristionchus fissidentatus]